MIGKYEWKSISLTDSLLGQVRAEPLSPPLKKTRSKKPVTPKGTIVFSLSYVPLALLDSAGSDKSKSATALSPRSSGDSAPLVPSQKITHRDVANLISQGDPFLLVWGKYL